MKRKKFKVVTLGCRTNQYESQAYIDQLKKEGYREATSGEKADVCIVNTCTVTESADKRSRYQIRKMARDYDPKNLIVTGCLAQRAEKELKQIPGVTHTIGNTEKEKLLNLVYPEQDWPEFKIDHFDAHTRAFVKIQDGCNSYCSYCVIPFVRGRSRSKKVSTIIEEIEGLVEKGFKEIVLTGINIGDFDGNENPKIFLSDLVKKIDQVQGIKRLRLSSIDPDEVDDHLLDAIVNGKNTCQSMHIVLQSGSNTVLKRMRRKYTKQDFLNTVSRLKKASPSFTFTTDVIFGFPGEDEHEFQETLSLIQQVKFAKVHFFPYSDRPKTRASRMPGKICSKTMNQRREKLLKVAEETAYQTRQDYVGKKMDILLESQDKVRPEYLMGHTDNFLPVFVPKKGRRPNDLISIVCKENTVEGLVADGG